MRVPQYTSHLTIPIQGARTTPLKPQERCWELRPPPQLPVWLCRIPPGDGSGTATTPRCGMMHVSLGNRPDFAKRHKAPKSGPKRSFSHRFALA